MEDQKWCMKCGKAVDNLYHHFLEDHPQPNRERASNFLVSKPGALTLPRERRSTKKNFSTMTFEIETTDSIGEKGDSSGQQL